MWIKEHEFARVKLADQKYKSKRKFSLDLTKNFGVIISTIYFSANFFFVICGGIVIRNFGTFLDWNVASKIAIEIFCGQKMKTIKITRNISPKWFWNWEKECRRRKCYWRRKTNSDRGRNKRIWRSSSSYQIKVFSD